VSRLEDRLRDAFRADAETVRPETIPGLAPNDARPSATSRDAERSSHPGRAWAAGRAAPTRPASRARRQRRPARARSLVPLAAAVAVAACVAGVSLVFPHLNGHRHIGGAPAPRPVLTANASRGVPASPGIPRFYATVIPGTFSVYVPPGRLPTNNIVVGETATGRVTGQINPPRGTVFAGIAATAGDRTFITALTPTSAEQYMQGRESSLPNGACWSQLYQFRLNNQGLPGPLVSLHITLPEVVAQSAGDLAITPDGRTIAYDAWCPVGLSKLDSELGVINLATRHAAVWSDNDVNFQDLIGPLSLSADGRLLGFGALLQVARVLNTSAPPGALLERSQVVSRDVDFVALASDGASVYGCTSLTIAHGKIVNHNRLTYYSISVATGRQRVVARLDNLIGQECWASLDPAGRYLLIEFATVLPGASAQSPAIVDLSTGRLVAYIDARSVYQAFDIAW
jgi:hypothetical protein